MVISYDVTYTPTLDLPILNALEDTHFDLDLIRDEDSRQLIFYFSTSEDMEKAHELFITNSSQKIEDTEYSLLDLVRIRITKLNNLENEKLNLRKRIAEIYRKQVEYK